MNRMPARAALFAAIFAVLTMGIGYEAVLSLVGVGKALMAHNTPRDFGAIAIQLFLTAVMGSLALATARMVRLQLRLGRVSRGDLSADARRAQLDALISESSPEVRQELREMMENMERAKAASVKSGPTSG